MMKTKWLLMFLAVALAVFFTAGSTSAGLLVYEPFNYTPETKVNGTPVNAGTGLTGTWISNRDNTNCRWVADSLPYGSLPIAGNKVRFHANSSPTAEAAIDPTVMEGRRDDGDTLWFGVLGYNANTTNSNTIRFAIGDMTNGLGFHMDRPGGSDTEVRIRAAKWVGGAETLSTGEVIRPTAIPEPDGTHLVVGKIMFGATDQLELYVPEKDLALPASPVASLSAAFDNSVFDKIRFAITNGNSMFADELRIGTTFNDVIGVSGASDPSPADGATVPVGDVDLSWTNMDPNSPGDPVYVDVWFGTEPNELDPGYDMIKVVTANIGDPDRSTWTVSAPTEGTYYWRVDSYINGNPSGDPIEGSVWSFYAKDDAPPSSVDAGIDMITWSGQAVELDATVVDDSKSALTYAWSADPAAGVVFDPSAAVEDPAVTITKAPGDAVTVTLTLAVHDEGNPTPVEDTMTIDVYDDACLAAVGAGVATIDPGDIDGNCITDLKDYAILAAEWLVDYALTAPVPK